MRKSFILFLLTVIVFSACTKQESKGNLVFVKGGTFVNPKSKLYGKNVVVPDFYIGKFEVTQEEWFEIMGNNPSNFKGENLPVEMVSWYDCITYCNERSMKEKLSPYYNIDKHKKDPDNQSEFDSLKWLISINEGANGYRLPTEVEWDYAAGGGGKSNGYTYSGSDDIDRVAWYWKNSGDTILTGTWNWKIIEGNHGRTKICGSKEPNELGLFDMSGNVREWCMDWYEDNEIGLGNVRVQRGGGWIGAEYRCETSNRHSFEANGKGPDQGVRICRSVY